MASLDFWAGFLAGGAYVAIGMGLFFALWIARKDGPFHKDLD